VVGGETAYSRRESWLQFHRSISTWGRSLRNSRDGRLQAKLLSLRSTVTSLQFVNQIDHLPDVVLHMRGTLQNHVEANLRIGSYRGVRT